MKSMFKILSVTVLSGFAIFLNAQPATDPTLLTVGGSKVTKSQFEAVYKKNSGKEQTADSRSVESYLDLYINFRLKVKEAEELGYDTLQSFKDELEGYRKQLAQPYLTDKEVNEKLLKEAYDRSLTDVRASHILVKLNDNALPKDTLEAYKKIMKFRDMVLGKVTPKMDFETAAKQYSEDPSAKENAGDLGYFTVLQMVYPFETAAYNTKVGEVSMPVRTRFGYHIIKVVDKRKAQGEILVAHIMVKTPASMTKDDSVNAKNKIEEIYQKAKKGDAFNELAQQYSDDKPSARKGGELPWFGTNRMPVEFEKASFELAANGDISNPVKTRYGWHVIKRIDKKETPTFEAIKNELKNKVSRDIRSSAGKSSLISRIKTETKFKENLKNRDELAKTIDSTYFQGNWKLEKAKGLTKELFNVGEKKYTQADFAKYLESHQARTTKVDPKILIENQYKNFVDESVIAFEESRLDMKYPEFKALMQEYRDGILLFELTDKKVWSKAVKDTIGLQAFYEKNKNNYLWDERAEASIYSCADEKTATKVREMLKKNKSEKDILAAINKDSQLNLQIESKIFQKKDNELVDANWNPGISANKSIDKRVQFVNVTKLLKPTPKAFNESKGLVTADYQAALEKEWIESLKAKYKVEVDKAVLSTIK